MRDNWVAFTHEFDLHLDALEFYIFHIFTTFGIP